jgi:hypothetical protein
MRSFALTYPQLMNQAIAAALDTEAVVRLRATYELAERFADGVYRPQGEPFLCHLVRTASIVLAEGQPLPSCRRRCSTQRTAFADASGRATSMARVARGCKRQPAPRWSSWSSPTISCRGTRRPS